MKVWQSRILAAGLAVVCLGVSTTAFAQARGYVVNGQGWMRMSPQERVAYVQGLNDSVNHPYVDDDLETAVVKYARTRCLIELKIAPNVLSDVITNGYGQRPEMMRETPLFVYVVRLSDICKRFITEERAKMGLPT